MARILLTMLGTNDYFPCNYVLDDKQKTNNIRFIQEAIANHHCKQWTEKDRILVFLTKEAKKKNWYDNGHLDRDGKPLQREGLKTRFEAMSLPMDIIPRDIPDGKSTDELWTIFMEIYNQLQEEDEIYLDTTHALRFLPMLALIILNYAEVIKKIKIKKVFYGAFEVLGATNKISKLGINERDVPIFDLTTFIHLFEWSKATHNFLAFGDARELKRITVKHVTPDLVKSKGLHQEAKTANKCARLLMDLSENIKTCRLSELITTDNHEALRKQLSKCKNEYLQPLQPLIEKIEEKVANFQKDDIRSGFAAVRWCIDYDLIQQGLTILQETVISMQILKHFSLEDVKDKNKRNLISKAINIKSREISEDKWKVKNEEKEVLRNIMDALNQELVKSYMALSTARNDINHAGFINPKSATKLKEDLEKNYEKLRDMMKN